MLVRQKVVAELAESEQRLGSHAEQSTAFALGLHLAVTLHSTRGKRDTLINAHTELNKVGR